MDLFPANLHHCITLFCFIALKCNDSEVTVILVFQSNCEEMNTLLS